MNDRYQRTVDNEPRPTSENNHSGIIATSLAIAVLAGGAIVAKTGILKSHEPGVSGLVLPAGVFVNTERAVGDHYSFDNGVGNQIQVDLEGTKKALSQVECGTGTVTDDQDNKVSLTTFHGDNPTDFSCIYEGSKPTAKARYQIGNSFKKAQQKNMDNPPADETVYEAPSPKTPDEQPQTTDSTVYVPGTEQPIAEGQARGQGFEYDPPQYEPTY